MVERPLGRGPQHGEPVWGARQWSQIQPRGQGHSHVEPSRHLDQGSGAQEEILLEVLAQGPGSTPLTAWVMGTQRMSEITSEWGRAQGRIMSYSDIWRTNQGVGRRQRRKKRKGLRRGTTNQKSGCHGNQGSEEFQGESNQRCQMQQRIPVR